MIHADNLTVNQSRALIINGGVVDALLTGSKPFGTLKYVFSEPQQLAYGSTAPLIRVKKPPGVTGLIIRAFRGECAVSVPTGVLVTGLQLGFSVFTDFDTLVAPPATEVNSLECFTTTTDLIYVQLALCDTGPSFAYDIWVKNVSVEVQVY